MPYASNSELPSGVKRLPEHGQTIYRKTFNSALQTYGGDEGKAAAVAWAAVKRQYTKVGDKWMRKARSQSEQAVNLTEAIGFSVPKDVDWEAVRKTGLLPGVSLAGRESTNGYGFSDRAMQQLTGMMAGPFYIDHKEPGKKFNSARDFGGTAENVRLDEARGRVVGDLRMARGLNRELICDQAETHAGQVGFSFNHDSILSKKDGRLMVEEIKRFHRLDYVISPATTGGMFETTSLTGGKDMDWEKVTLEELREQRPDLHAEIVAGAKQEDTKDRELTELRQKLAGHEQAEAKRKKESLIETVLTDKIYNLGEEARKTLRPALEQTDSEEAMRGIVSATVEHAKALTESTKTKSQERKPDGDKSATKEDFVAAWRNA